MCVRRVFASEDPRRASSAAPRAGCGTAEAKQGREARWRLRRDCAGDRSRRQRFVDTVCIGLSRAQKAHGAIVDAIVAGAAPLGSRTAARVFILSKSISIDILCEQLLSHGLLASHLLGPITNSTTV
jgi:hypothetical protein